MDIATLENNLKAGKLNNIYLLYGEERFLLDNCVKKINKLFGGNICIIQQELMRHLLNQRNQRV